MDEEAARERMRELADAGDYAGALSAYVELEARLQAELKVAPSRETRRLLDEIRRDAPPPLGTGGRRLGPDPA
jgi:DNA-binding SARP family transcriptional activator